MLASAQLDPHAHGSGWIDADCRIYLSGCCGQRAPRALAGRLRRARTFLRTLGIETVFSREGRLGMRTIRIMAIDERTDPITASAPSAASATMERERVQPRGLEWCFDWADDADGADANSQGGIQRSRPAFQASRMPV